MAKKTQRNGNCNIVSNKKAKFDFFLQEKFEAGLSLQGWEVKSIRAGKVNLNESYVLIKNGECFLFGCFISPLVSASSHKKNDPLNTRKLLLHKKEIQKLIGAVERKGYSLIPLSLYWKKQKVKCAIALAKGKKEYDKRAAIKERMWNIDKQRLLKR
jgi:SsrA-binding protein